MGNIFSEIGFANEVRKENATAREGYIKTHEILNVTNRKGRI